MSEIEENIVPNVDETLDFDMSLKKKKKKSKAVSFIEADELDVAPAKEESTDPAVEELTDMFSGLKKKKKKVITDLTAFKQELEEAGVNDDEDEEDDEEKNEGEDEIEDDTFDKGEEEEAGWLKSDREYTYDELLHRFFKILRTNNPELAGERGQRYKIPPPSVMREGNKKTIFANLKDISDRMHRPYEHVMQFLFAELGTSGSVDGNSRLVIKGRFQQKQLENVLRRYIMEYVTCKTCKSISTHLAKENRLYFLVCESCGSRRSVSGIKTGFQAHIGKRKKLPG